MIKILLKYVISNWYMYNILFCDRMCIIIKIRKIKIIRIYHMSRTTPLALSLQKYWENRRVRAVHEKKARWTGKDGGRERKSAVDGGHIIKCLLTELGRAEPENIWHSVMVHGPRVRPSDSVNKYINLKAILRYSSSVFYDFLLNSAELQNLETRRQFQS